MNNNIGNNNKNNILTPEYGYNN